MYQIISKKWGVDAVGKEIKLVTLLSDSEADALPSDLPIGSECIYTSGRRAVYFGEEKWVTLASSVSAPSTYAGVPREEIDFEDVVYIEPGKMYVGKKTGGVHIVIQPGIEGVDNEWMFTITIPTIEPLGMFGMPVIQWGLGIAPTFEKNTTTVCRLYYVNDVLCGEWVSL